ncbi:MAG: hypothetical protein LBN26_05300 [Christensenellaceae bacterium]|jgi:hypothetical protein|nr:hypothetical protein [Christensenellaceae bacterium]
MKNKLLLSRMRNVIFAIAFVLLAVALIIGAFGSTWDARALVAPAETLGGFTYEIAGGAHGEAAFPYSLENLAPNMAVTVYANIEPGKYENLLVKTVYTRLRLYADDALIYECGQPGSYPSWLLDPPTLLKIVPLPQAASELRFEYISPSQRTTMSLPDIAAGSDGALSAWLFAKNVALLSVSIFLLILGLAATIISLLFQRGGAVFLHLGLFALAAGCWSFGECNATAFLVPYPVLLYLMAFGGLFSLAIPLLRYGLLIISPKKPRPMRLAATILEAAVIVALALQLTGTVALSKSMYVFHIIVPLALVVFAATTVYEHFRHKNPMAKRFALPILVIAAFAILEVVNYSLRFTDVLSLFFLLGTLIFTLMLGVIGVRYAADTRMAYEEAAAKNDFYHKMSHGLRTPMTVVSTCIQTVRRRPTEAAELLPEAQTEIMKIAKMIDDALEDGDEGEVRP